MHTSSYKVILFAVIGTCSALMRRAETDDLKTDGEVLPEWAKTPIVWVHTPKTGTSFLNTLLHHKGLCPNVPDDLWYGPPTWLSDHAFLTRYDKRNLCPGAFSENYDSPPGSLGVATVWEKDHNHVMSFFREPEARLTSGFYHKLHDWPHHLSKGHEFNIRGYAQVMQGCQVRMLTWEDTQYRDTSFGHKACGGNGTAPKDEEVQLAIERMKQMKFVGITEEYDFSVCLFHKLYGGECHDHEFKNVRPGGARIRSDFSYQGHFFSEADRDLKGFQDPYDGALYKAAKERFYSMMRENNVNRASCEKICKSATVSQPFTLKDESKGLSLFKNRLDMTANLDAYNYDWPGRPSYYVDEDYFDDEA